MCLCPVNLPLSKVSVGVALRSRYHTVQVPCGKCLECRRVRVNSWYVRLLNEFQRAPRSAFLTFTYDDAHLPFSSNGLMSLCYRDFQLFCKRARKAGFKFKYFCAGEYGTKLFRPHYHVLFFFSSLTDVEEFGALWSLGHVNFGFVSESSIYYTLKYIDKAVFNEVVCGDDRVRERALMSKGLGLAYLTDFMVKYFHDDPSRCVVLRGGSHVSLPRYYRDRIFSDSEKVSRRLSLSEYVSDRLDLFSDPLFADRVRQMYRRSAVVSNF